MPALLAVLAAVLLVVHTLTGGEILGGEVQREIGVWLGLVVGLGAAAVLVLSWLQRTGRMRKPAPAAPTGGPWSQQQPPQGWGQQQPEYGQQAPGGYPGGTPGYGQQQALQLAFGPLARVARTVVQRPLCSASSTTILPPGGSAVPSSRSRPEKRTRPAPLTTSVEARIVALARVCSHTSRERCRTPVSPA